MNTETHKLIPDDHQLSSENRYVSGVEGALVNAFLAAFEITPEILAVAAKGGRAEFNMKISVMYSCLLQCLYTIARAQGHAEENVIGALRVTFQSFKGTQEEEKEIFDRLFHCAADVMLDEIRESKIVKVGG